MFTLVEDILCTFTDFLTGYAALTLCLFAVMDERGWQRLKKLPVLLFAPLTVTFISLTLYAAIPEAAFFRYCINSCFNLLACALWARWAWRTGFWWAFAAVCMAGVFQVAASTLSWMLLKVIPLDRFRQFLASEAVFWAAVLTITALLHFLRFGSRFRLLRENESGRRMALLLFALESSMEMLLLMQNGIREEYLIAYHLLVITTAGLITGLVTYLAQRLDAVRQVEAQRSIIAQQQLYEQDLESIRREVRSFRHDYKNLLAGLSEQADEGELDKLRDALAELDAGFDRRIGEKIQASAQLGNVRIPQVRSLLLSKLTGMGEKGIDSRLEILYPVETLDMDPWDFTRCLGILLDNAIEAVLDVKTPWVETVLLAQEGRLSLRISNPYTGTIDPDKIWAEGFSTKGKGQGLLPRHRNCWTRFLTAAGMSIFWMWI